MPQLPPLFELPPPSFTLNLRPLPPSGLNSAMGLPPLSGPQLFPGPLSPLLGTTFSGASHPLSASTLFPQAATPCWPPLFSLAFHCLLPSFFHSLPSPCWSPTPFSASTLQLTSRPSPGIPPICHFSDPLSASYPSHP